MKTYSIINRIYLKWIIHIMENYTNDKVELSEKIQLYSQIQRLNVFKTMYQLSDNDNRTDVTKTWLLKKVQELNQQRWNWITNGEGTETLLCILESEGLSIDHLRLKQASQLCIDKLLMSGPGKQIWGCFQETLHRTVSWMKVQLSWPQDALKYLSHSSPFG